MAKLIVIEGNLEGQVFELKEGSTTVGRQTDCDVRIEDPSVSGHHCTIDVAEDSCTVKDSGSTNGTAINGKEIQEQPLETGDILNVGSVRMRLESDNEQPVSVQPPENLQPPEPPQTGQSLSGGASGFCKRRNRKTVWISITVLLTLVALAALTFFLLKLFA
ncbi:MAG: FHA domain-containing protein [Verrucomicrobiota bacterium]